MLRIVNFALFNSHTNDVFTKIDLVKLEGLIEIEQLKIMSLFVSEIKPIVRDLS